MKIKDEVKALMYVLSAIATIAFILLSVNFFGSWIRDYKVIEPVDGVQCVVVSRLFNTSVDCWEKKNGK